MRRISTAIVVLRLSASKEIEVLLQLKRKYGQWEFPGGKLEEIETAAQCACRELKEETGIRGRIQRPLTYVDHCDKFGCVVFKVSGWWGIPSIMEPDKHSALGWFPIDDLPENLTQNTQSCIEAGVLENLNE